MRVVQRKRKTKDPCLDCGLHRDLCLCEHIPQLNLKTRVCLLIHHRELKRTSNTGKLALKALLNSESRVRGLKNQVADLSDLLCSPYRTLLFFPSDQAEELTLEFVRRDSRPIQLLVPDGNWRQASKVNHRHPELRNIERVKISTPNLATQHLRAEHFAEGMSTLQAIAKALGVIEGPEVENSLQQLYEFKLSRTLQARGAKISIFPQSTNNDIEESEALD